VSWRDDERVRGLAAAVLCVVGGLTVPWLFAVLVMRLAGWLDRLRL